MALGKRLYNDKGRELRFGNQAAYERHGLLDDEVIRWVSDEYLETAVAKRTETKPDPNDTQQSPEIRLTRPEEAKRAQAELNRRRG